MKNQNKIVLTRNRLNKKLENVLQYPMTLVTAPMGFGKTTAVRSFFSDSNIPYIWLTMTESIKIAKSEYFWFLLVRGVRNRSPKVAEILEDRGFPGDSVQIARMLDLFENMEVSELTVVIDDYYKIETAEINQFLRSLILGEIPWLHIVLIGRKMPELDVEELKIKGMCFFISAQDIAFREEEIYQYLEIISFHGDEQLKEQISVSAGGWIAAVYLMAVSYQKDEKEGMLDSLNSMLKKAFFDPYDTRIQEFLYKLSFFDMVTEKQVIYLFEDPEASLLLRKLYSENAFIMLEHAGEYKFHQIYLDFLQMEREGYTLDIKHLMDRAGEWYSMQNDHALAFKYWMLAGNYKAVLNELEKTDIRNINSIDRKLIFEVYRQIEDDWKYEYPIATLKYIWLVILFVDKHRGENMLYEFERYFKQHDHKRYTRNQILGEIAIVSTTVAFNDAEKVVYYTNRAAELLQGEKTIIRNRKGVLPYGVPHFTYDYYKKPGKYLDTVNILAEGFKSHIEVTDGCGMGCIPLIKAEYDLETGNFDQVERWVRKSMYESELWEQKPIYICTCLTLARLYLYEGRWEEVKKILDKLQKKMRMEQNTIILNALDNCIGYIYGCLGEYERIPSWIRSGDTSVNTSRYQGSAFNYVVCGKAMLLEKKYEELDIASEVFQEYFGVFQNQLGYIHNYIHGAVARGYLYGQEEGVKYLQKALEIAYQDNIIMPFVENAEYIISLLKQTDQEKYGKLTEKILDRCGKRHDNQKNPCGLSPREEEILLLIEAGASQREIAETLFISPNTVKRHVQNIYHKLEANNKTLAIRKYHELRHDCL